MISTLQYDDLRLLLTKEDLQQIKDMPSPSLEQARLVIKTWEDFFGANEVPQTPEKVKTGIIWIKPYLRAYEDYPELFI